MAKIKSYTDIEQSKKLAEILPLETADMYYDGFGRLPQGYAYTLISPNSFEYDKPCWSLAALISIIPQEIFNGEYIINITEGKNYKWIITYDDYCEDINYSYYGLSSGADTLVDACYKMILKLKERNLL